MTQRSTFRKTCWTLSHQYFLKQKKRNQYPKKQKILPLTITSSRNRHQQDCDLLPFMPDDDESHRNKLMMIVIKIRLTDGCFHNNLEINVRNSLSNNQKIWAFTQIKFFLIWWHHHTRGINMIIDSQIVASCQQQFFKLTEEISVPRNRNFLILKIQLRNKHQSYYQFFPYENHCESYKTLAWRLWPVLFTLTNFFLYIHFPPLLENKKLFWSLFSSVKFRACYITGPGLELV